MKLTEVGHFKLTIVGHLNLTLTSGTQGPCRGPEANLPGRERIGCGSGPGYLRGQRPGGTVSGRGPQLARGVVAGGTVLRVLGTDPQGDLHHQRDRESQQRGSPGGEAARSFHQSPGGAEVDLSGVARGERQVAKPRSLLGRGETGVCDPLRRSIRGVDRLCDPRPGREIGGRMERTGNPKNFTPPMGGVTIP